VNNLFLTLLFLCFYSIVSAQKDSLIIENRTVSRLLYFSKDSAGFYTKSFINKRTNQNYVNPGTEEFSILINENLIEGKDCRYLRHSYNRQNNIQTLSVTLQTPYPKVYIQLEYEVYENIPIVRKQLNVINEGNIELVLTNLDVEKLRFQVVNKFDNEVYTSFGTNINRIPYKGDYNDAAILLYNLAAQQGAIIGNEAPSVLKNTEIYTQIHGCIQVGMRHIQESFPFKKWLAPGETFRSPKTFIYVFQSPRWQDGFENEYKDFVRKYLGASLFTHKKTPLVLYSTWIPFLDNINDKLIRDCADNLADIGTDLFIIDAGWYKYSGDFIPDSTKFPNGLKSIGDYIHKKGMKLGLWFTVGTVNAKSNIASKHPEWLIRDKNGNPANLHNMSPSTDGMGWSDELTNISLGTPYYDHLKTLVANYIKELDISYVKFDLSIITSAYVHDIERNGDYDANSSKLYRDRASSYWVSYERMMQLMDDLHQQFPDLLIDCTFEAWGRYNTVDYALIQHADYDWLTNFEQKPPAGPISIRQMNFDRSRVIPASTLLIGNQSLNFSNYQYVYFSLASASIVLVGDPRKLQPAQKSFYLKWNNYLKELENKYQYSRYFQLYDVFDRPTNSNWDGCYRINTEKMGGLLFFFRNNSSDVQRIFKIPCLDSNSRYKIYSCQKKKVLGIYSGKILIEKGITVKIPTIYSALILTIEKV
jgi:alpha-galactosidase